MKRHGGAAHGTRGAGVREQRLPASPVVLEPDGVGIHRRRSPSRAKGVRTLAPRSSEEDIDPGASVDEGEHIGTPAGIDRHGDVVADELESPHAQPPNERTETPRALVLTANTEPASGCAASSGCGMPADADVMYSVPSSPKQQLDGF